MAVGYSDVLMTSRATHLPSVVNSRHVVTIKPLRPRRSFLCLPVLAVTDYFIGTLARVVCLNANTFALPQAV